LTANDLGAYVVYDSDKFHLMSPDGQHIMAVLLDEWARQFTDKNIDYGGDENKLGVAGAFVDIHRKEGKLKRAIWDGQTLNGEQPREILLDLIGHCFLTIAAIDKAATNDKESDA
jgi:hypothetical protein